MAFLNDLPTCSVQRRHAMAERARVLGLPPSDSVLRRHHEQLMRAQQAAPAGAAGAAGTQAMTRVGASGGGLWAWLRRLFGG